MNLYNTRTVWACWVSGPNTPVIGRLFGHIGNVFWNRQLTVHGLREKSSSVAPTSSVYWSLNQDQFSNPPGHLTKTMLPVCTDNMFYKRKSGWVGHKISFR